MVNAVQAILRLAYCYGLAVGVMNFEVDWPTGKAIATRRVTIFSAVHNIGLITLLSVLGLSNNNWKSTLDNARLLHEYFFLLMTVVRNLAVMLSMITRWIQRSKILRLWNQIIELVRERPSVVLRYRRHIIIKFVFCVLSDSMHMILDISAQRKNLTFGLCVSLLVGALFTTIFNMIVVQYYIAILQILGLYNILEEDLRHLIGEAETICLTRKRGGGVFATKCCFLADQLDQLAERHSKLKDTLGEMSEIFQIQSLSMSMVYYLSSVGSIYFTFCSILYNTTGFGSTYWGLLLIALSTIFFYADNWITLNIGFDICDQENEVTRVLAERTLFSQELDTRLETAFENFQLQLARDPYEFYVLGLFKVERSQLMAMANSILIHSIMLVQSELKNN
ncbi:putative gustatory receptor 59c [Drosophila elegans]|uniref:putative gustatory receptor 59c n=1 Tax=Drosophila elegans TaxID=30023 RepID=UPI0007E80B03|nr:putative gustatory receptor 59c [Drosophila elegans]